MATGQPPKRQCKHSSRTPGQAGSPGYRFVLSCCHRLLRWGDKNPFDGNPNGKGERRVHITPQRCVVQERVHAGCSAWIVLTAAAVKCTLSMKVPAHHSRALNLQLI